MKKNLLIAASAAMAIAFFFCPGNDECFARPAIRGLFDLYQPDGTSIKARLSGDEFMKILTTSDGCAISQGEDGWYYYTRYDQDGYRVRTEYKAGQDAPADIKSKCRIIPYDLLSARAAEKRAAAYEREEDNVLVRTRAAGGIATRSGGTSTEKHGIVILAQFSDLKFQSGHTRASFEALLTEPGYSANGADGSAIDYFNEQFSGLFTFSFDVSDIVTLPHNYAYYGANDNSGEDKNAAQMIIDACTLADSQIDFSRYDDDGDGQVDNVFVFFAGGDEADQAGEDHIWSHAWYILDGAGERLVLDGVYINRYACTSELSRNMDTGRFGMASIGTFCHEFSHTLGLSDYYDTDYEQSGGYADAMWTSTALMDGGNFNNNGCTPPNLTAVELDELELFEPVMLTAGTHVLEPINESRQYYRMDTDTEGEYFLFECRAEEGWDKYIGGSGLLIYHIDKSRNSTGFSGDYGNLTAAERWMYNMVNCKPDHQCADLVEADPSVQGTAYEYQQNVSKVFFPYTKGSSKHDSFSALTDPAFVYWNGNASPLAISGIRKEGNNIVMTVSEFDGDAPKVGNVSSEVFQDAAIISWTSSDQSVETGYIRWKKSSGSDEYTVQPVDCYEPGKFAWTIDGLTPRTPYKCELYFSENADDAVPCSFMTKSPREVNYPFIYLFNVRRNQDGTYPSGSRFPLRLYNAYDAEKIIWYMDGQEVETGPDGYYTPAASGVMRAEIFYNDGTKSIVETKIVIK